MQFIGNLCVREQVLFDFIFRENDGEASFLPPEERGEESAELRVGRSGRSG